MKTINLSLALCKISFTTYKISRIKQKICLIQVTIHAKMWKVHELKLK